MRPERPGDITSDVEGTRDEAAPNDVRATRAVVLVPDLPNGDGRAGTERKGSLHSTSDRLSETAGLARAIDLDVVYETIVRVPAVRPATLLGSGKVAEIGEVVQERDVGLVIVDHALTPIQQRNLERDWNAKVLDRTGLILEIFGRRARTREGRLQVELAHLTFQRSRLVRSWTHLERQRGGVGFLGGPGETQIETDRRLLRERIDKLRSELDKVRRTRALHREGRGKVPYPVVAIVGYTNAGKSTLFNRVTGAGVLAKDQVFATLDPTMRELALSGRKVILSDTVGFISDLPTMLVAAFRATLEEVVAADLILHVRDISHPETEAQRADVDTVLEDLLGTAPERADIPIVEVWNKIDLLDEAGREAVDVLLERARRHDREPVCVSAATGQGIETLLARIDQEIGADDQTVTVRVPPGAGGLRHWLHENAAVLSSEAHEDGSASLNVRVSSVKYRQLLHRLEAEGLSAAHEADITG